MYDTILPPLPTLYNVLPVRYKTWLAFYDDIPEQYRDEKSLRHSIEISRQEYAQLSGVLPEPLLVGLRADYEISREFMLARVGEELLASRLRREDINTLEAAMYTASKYDSSAIFSKAVDLLTPIWAAARPR